MLGAKVVPVGGRGTLKDAVNAALRAWVSEVDTTHYCVGSVIGPYPYPWMVREFQRVVGDEARAQCGPALPDVVVACVGGGSNAAGTFAAFLDTPARLVGVEAAGSAVHLLRRTEGILPALESAHALAWVLAAAGTDELPAGSTVLVTLSGRGDKDIDQIREAS